MDQLMLLLTPLLPLLLAPLLVHDAGRLWLLVPAALPALLTALSVPVGSDLSLPWLLLGSALLLDGTSQLFLLFSAVVWLAAALQLSLQRGGPVLRGGFGAWFLTAMAGNFLLLLAADALTFYAGFALMGLSVYGLIVPQRGQRARRTGQVYLAFTLVGEVALFAGIAILAASRESLLFVDLAQQAVPPAAVALLLFGFGIKVALPGLHLWLPLTYTVAPAVAVAVLSGPMMKAGLVGWLRFLPPGTPGLEAWAMPLLVLGGSGVVLGVLLGVLQRTPRAVLAYSSVAKMGLISALFAIAWLHPQQADAIIAALLLFAVHHLLVKSALFLGVGLHEHGGPKTGLLPGLGMLALILAAAPFTAGAAAKQLLGRALDGELVLLMTLSAIGSAWLMIRFMLTLRHARRPVDDGVAVGMLPFAAVAVLALWAPFPPTAMTFESSALYPLVFAALSALAARRWLARWEGLLPPPGRAIGRVVRAYADVRRGMAQGVSRIELPRLAFSPLASLPANTPETGWLGGGIRWLTVLGLLVLLGFVFN